MRKLKHDNIRYGTDFQAHSGAGPEKRIQRLGRWLWRAIGRSCASGLWTISPDGQLRCEPLRTETGQTD